MINKVGKIYVLVKGCSFCYEQPDFSNVQLIMVTWAQFNPFASGYNPTSVSGCSRHTATEFDLRNTAHIEVTKIILSLFNASLKNV